MTRERDELGDEVVARAWREHMRETPPAAIDDAIRAAARRAVGAQPREKALVAEAREPWRWWMPLAAAATIGAIAIGVLQNLPQDTGEPTVVSDAVTARRAAPASVPAASPSASDARSSVDAIAKREASGDAPAPKSAVDAMSTPSPEQRDRVPLPLPRTQAPVQAAPPPLRQEAAKPDARARSDAPSETKEADVAPRTDDKLVAPAPQPPVAALGKRADENAAPARRNEADAAPGFVASPPASEPASVAAAKQAYPASPPPQSEPSVVAAAKQAAPASPAPAAAAEATGAARAAPEAAESNARAKVRPAPPQAAGDVVAARATREPQAMAVTPPDVFIAAIRRLLAANDREGAVRELQRFRRTHADADGRLPVDLREFAATVPRP